MKEYFWTACFVISFLLIPLYTFGYEWNNGRCIGGGETEAQRANDSADCIAFKSVFAAVAYPIYWTVVLQEKKP